MSKDQTSSESSYLTRYRTDLDLLETVKIVGQQISNLLKKMQKIVQHVAQGPRGSHANRWDYVHT